MSEIRDKTIREVILSTDGNIVISADAGTGKTYMTVERIKRDVIKMDNYQTYAAITFTNKAAKELTVRLGVIQSGFVGTNDKFILNEVIVPFSKDVYPQIKGKEIRTDYSQSGKCELEKELLRKFIDDGTIGTYTDLHKNFAFKLALNILQKSHAARRYLKNRYFRIYVDEYQDSDLDMHKFFMYLNKELNIPFFIVGDIKQSIYEWRGGYTDGFKDLLDNNKYTVFKLLHNFRSNIQIQNYASIFMDDITGNYQKSCVNGEVQGCVYSIKKELVLYIEQWLLENKNCAFLVYSNKSAKEWANLLDKLQFVYIPRAPIDAPELENSQVWIARCIANYFYKKRYNEFSFYDEIPNQDAYDIDIIRNNLLEIKNEYDRSGWTEFIEKSIEKIYQYLLVSYDEKRMKFEIQKLKETIEDTQYEKSFNMELYERIVTTIHSSKGLQYNQVIINSDDFVYNNEFNNSELHYVAITRPEERLLVLFNRSGRKADVYFKVMSERVKMIEINGVKQVIENVMEIVKV